MRKLSLLLITATILSPLNGFPAAPEMARMRAVMPQPLGARDMPAILSRLASDNPDEKIQALSSLLNVQPASATAEALPQVIAITKLKKKDDKDYTFGTLQTMAVQALGYIPQTGESIRILFDLASGKAVPDACKDNTVSATGVQTAEELRRQEEARLLRQQMAGQEADCESYKYISRTAAQQLPIDDNYLPQLKIALKNDDPSTRNNLISRLRMPNTLTPGLAEMLKDVLLNDPDGMVKTTAAQVVADKAQDHPEFAGALIAAIKAENNTFRKQFYVRALSLTKGASHADLPLFVALLKNTAEDDTSRYYSASIIGSMGEKAAGAVPALMQAAKGDPSELVRGYAAEALGKIGPKAADAIPVLAAILTDRSKTNYRYMAAEALGYIADKNNKEATAALIAAMQDRETETQTKALIALKTQGNNSPAVLDALKRINITAGSPQEHLYLDVLRSLSGSTEGATLAPAPPENEALLADLTDADEKVQQKALLLLSRKEKLDASFVPGLVKALYSQETLNVWYACAALSKTGTAGKPAIVPIMDLIKMQQVKGTGYSYCLNALATIAPADKTVLSFLNELMMNEKNYFSFEPANALAKAGDGGVPYLVAALKSDNPKLIYVVTAALTQTTGNAREAVPVLLELLKQPDKLADNRPADGGRTMDNILAAIAHIAPDSKELEQARTLVNNFTSPTPVIR